MDEDNNEIAECINEFNCSEGFGIDWAHNICWEAEDDDITTPNCVAYHWHDDPDANFYWCDECEFGYYFRDYAYDEDSGELYPPYCYPNFWVGMEDNLKPYYWRRSLLDKVDLLPNDGGDMMWKPV